MAKSLGRAIKRSSENNEIKGIVLAPNCTTMTHHNFL